MINKILIVLGVIIHWFDVIVVIDEKIVVNDLDLNISLASTIYILVLNYKVIPHFAIVLF